ncbi:hypothetical protein [Streptomyces sp. enrichment culture]|uniref:hypothetical protein n=1 Tax=Streptomyces sp. enrichment culture TaxID=1795815 RepID=UPI003F557C79
MTTTTRRGPLRARAALTAVAVTAAAGLLAGAAGAGTAQAHSAAVARTAAERVVPAAVPEADPTPEEQQRLREIAGAIWTPQLAAGWNMNSEVEAVLSTATGEILKCSEAFALVPRPPAFFPGPSYLRQYWKQIRDYFLVVKDNRTYRVCVVATAVNYRSAIEMASMGI